MTKKQFTSDILHTKFKKPDAFGSISMPIYNSVAYEFESAEAMEKAFSGLSNDHSYSRISNPTVEYFENRIKSITDAKHVTALSSGMAAISNIIFTLAKAGMNLVTSNHLFGNTYVLFHTTLATFGVEVRFCDLTNLEEVEKNIDENTCGLFLEIITNPQMEVADLDALSKICKRKNIPLIADSTIVPFTHFKASDFGVDIETISSTKYISGGATSVGGLIIDYGTFDWSKTSALSDLAKSQGNDSFNYKLRKEIHRNLGAYMSPQVAYMQSLGLESLEVRYLRAAQTTKQLVEALSNYPKIEKVNYNGLKKNHFYEISNRQFGEYPGAMFTIDLASKEACFRFMNRLQVIHRATNLFDNHSLAIHPASTIYVNFSQEKRDDMNISDKTIRFSVGLEEFEVLMGDFERGLG